MAVKVINAKVDPSSEDYFVAEYEKSAEEAVVQAWIDHSGEEGDPPEVVSNSAGVYCGRFGVLPDTTVVRPNPRQRVRGRPA